MKILDRLPLLPETRTIRFRERYVPFHRNALLVWMSVGFEGDDASRISPAFPGLLDSGNNTECFLHDHHLVDWAGIRPSHLETQGSIFINGEDISQLKADAWIHPNLPGMFERDPHGSPFRLHIAEGIAVARPRPDNTIFPRVPLLGFSALKRNAMDYWFDSETGCSYVRTADWRSRLVRWLYRLF